ncbi:MAG: hypothetical protein QOD62_3071 [Actinomycetota bacterium]|nr:hypothetical protein [Actinomycetota bacterium]
MIIAVAAGGHAARAGISAGDMITAINGHKVTLLADPQILLAQLSPGATATVAIVGHNGSSGTVSVVVGQLQG